MSSKPLIVSIIIVLIAVCPLTLRAQARQRLDFDADWRFTKSDAPDGNQLAYATIKSSVLQTGARFLKAGEPLPAADLGKGVSFTQPGFDDSQWRPMTLPHDWGVDGAFEANLPGGTGKLPFFGIGWYRKHFALPAGDSAKRIFLDIDGAMSYANVWLNGNYVGGWPYGYSSFRLDLTPYAKFGGDNVIAIRLDNPPNSSRWYPGGGIYRNVWLVKTSPIHVGQWGTCVTTPQINADSASVELNVKVDNDGKSDANVSMRTEIFPIDSDDHRTGPAVATTDATTLQISAGKDAKSTVKATIAKPMLWSTKSPRRYVAVTTILQNGQPLDSYEMPFGIRTVQFDPVKGMLINGEAVKIQGVCDHADLGPLGSIVNTRGLQRQIEILQSMGCNAIRTSHNPPAPELLDLCDKMGMVVMDEMFDCWARQKTPNDYHLLFNDWSEMDGRMLLYRDRNHPSIVMWSVGNEIGEADSPAGQTIAKRLTALCHEVDPTRAVTSARNSYNSGFNGYQNIMDVFGFNYLRNAANNFQMYIAFHEANPNKMVYSSESASCISTRGVYAFAPPDQFNNKSGGAAPNGQMSSYDLYAPAWACPPDWEWKAQDMSGVAAGEFVWTGFDYLGEPTRNGAGGRGRGGFGGGGGGGPQARSSYFGIIDLAGFPKDRFYLYQARWRPDLKMAHILPHWTWPDRAGQVTPVHVYTSGDEAELFLNGKSMGRKKLGQYEYRLRWDDVVYEPGELRVVAYKKGQQWAEDVVRTAGPATSLKLTADRAQIAGDGKDLSYVTISVVDKDGRLAPNADNRLNFAIEGPGEIAGVDNGDPTNLEAFKSNTHPALGGLCLVIVRAKSGQSGPITLRAAADGLSAGSVVVSAK